MPRFLPLLLLVVVLACYRNAETENTPCTGTRFVVVSNNSTRAIDVYTFQNGQRTVIGTVTAGSSGEFPFVGAPGTVGYRVEGSGAPVPESPPSPVQMRDTCR